MYTNIINKIIDICETIKTREEIFQDKSDGIHPKKHNQSSGINQSYSLDQSKVGSNQTVKPLEEDRNKIEHMRT